MKKPKLNIALAVDDNFVYPLSVLIVSLLENNKQNDIKVHLFSASIKEVNITKIKELINSYNQKFRFYKLNQSDFANLPHKDRISVAAFYRVLIPEVIEESVDKYLYLDADIIVLGDISPLFEIDLKDYVIAAINDIAAIDMKKHDKHNIPEKYLYFNSGVLLVDKNNWLKANAGQRILKYRIENHDICDFLDQDGFNGALFKERLSIPPKWNQQIGLYFISYNVAEKVYENSTDIIEALKQPIIVHFNGREKPWNQVSAHPFQREFDKYSGMISSFKYYEAFNWKKFIKRNFIYKIFGWINVNRYYYYKTKD